MAHISTFSLAFIFLIISHLTHGQSLANYEKAQAAYQDYQYDEAIIYLKNILKNEPSNVAAKILFIKVLLGNGDGHLAEAELEKSRALGINQDQLMLLFADAYIAQGKYNETLNLLDQDQLPNIAMDEVLVKKGLAQIGLTYFIVAKKSFEQALEINANNIDAQVGLAQIHIIEHQAEQALPILKNVTSGYLAPINAWAMLGSVYIELGEPSKALSALNSALNENPNHIPSLLTRAGIYVESQQAKAADNDLELVLAQSPYQPQAVFLKATLAAQSENKEVTRNALAEVTEIIEHMPNEYLKLFPNYYYLASYSFYLQKELALAKSYINSYLNVDEYSTRALQLSASIDIKSGDYGSAANTLNKANLIKPNNPEILSLLGAVHLTIKNSDKAEFFFRQAKSAAPNNQYINAQLAQALLATSHFNEAQSILESNRGDITQDPLSLTINHLLISAYLQQNKLEEALAINAEMIKSDENNAQYHHQAGLLWQSKGDYDQALQALDKAIALDDTFIKAIVSKAQFLFAQNQTQQAIEFLDQTAKRFPENIDVLLALAISYRQINQLGTSYRWFEIAYQLEPENFKVMEAFVLMNVLMNQGQHALEIAKKYQADHVLNYQLILLLGELHRFNGEFNKAISIYQDAFKLTLTDVEKAKINHLMAKVYQQYKQINKATSTYIKAVAWHANEELLIDFSQFYLAIGKADLAESLIARHILKLPSKKIQLMYGQTLLSNQKFEQALKQFQSINSNNVQVDVGIAKAFIGLDKKIQAKKHLNSHLKTKPDNQYLLMSLAEIYVAESNWDQAENVFQQLVELSPTPQVFNNAAYIAIQHENYTQAKLWSLQSVQLNGQDPDSLDTLGLALFHLNDNEQALPHFRKALAINNNRADIKYHLAQSLVKLNRNREALQLLAESVNSQMNFAGKEAAKALLDSLIEQRKSTS